MESRNLFSRLKKGVKNRLAGKKTDSDKPGDDASGTRREPTDPLPQQEQHMLADDSRRGEGDVYHASGNQSVWRINLCLCDQTSQCFRQQTRAVSRGPPRMGANQIGSPLRLPRPNYSSVG
jgi:hypothetical protein